MEHDEIKLKIVDMADGKAVIKEAKARGKPLTVDQRKTLEKIEREEEKGTFNITDEEIKKMSKTIKGKFFTKGFAVCWRKRQTGKTSFTYQVRFQRDGYNIQFHEKIKTNLKSRFLEELKKATDRSERQNGIPETMTQFSYYYFERFRKIKVKEKTYQSDVGRLKNYILPYFKEMRIEKITPTDCQQLLESILKDGKGKTADEIYSLLNGIFNCAIKHHLIKYSPMDTVVHVQHERQHGKALTKEEESFLLNAVKGTPFELAFAVGLFTGLRPNEFESAKIEGKFIVAINSKRKNKAVVYKKIPITPKLRPYLEGVDQLNFFKPETLRIKIKELLPDHILYDLRTTFYTRCKECGISDAARDEFVGHSLGALGNAYTDISDEFLIREGEKLNY